MARCLCTRWYVFSTIPPIFHFVCLPCRSATSTDSFHRKQICQTTGWGGQPVRAHGAGGDFFSSDSDVDLAAKLEPVTDAKRMRVTFNASVSDVLPWKFVPQQREVRVLPGETALAFYTATNKSDKDIIGVATYSVTPAQVAPYFSKIQCFCFEEQRLNAGETVDMPVFFYLDPDYLNDLNMKGIETVTLSYTFFSKFITPVRRGFGWRVGSRKLTVDFSSFPQRPSTMIMAYLRAFRALRRSNHYAT